MGNRISKKPNEAETFHKKIEMSRSTGILNLNDMKLKQANTIWVQISNDEVLLQKLRSLDISDNSMKTLPQEIILLLNLKTLIAARCSIQKISNVLNPLRKLQYLDLSHNDLEIDTLEIVQEVPSSGSLSKINLSNNHFSGIPTCLYSLLQLKELDLSGNRIESINGIGVMISLVLINLDDNHLVEISQDACLLINLKKISLRNNRIKKNAITFDGQSIPEMFLMNTFVESIELNGNPLTNSEIMKFHGVDVFLERRKKVKDRALQGGALTDFSGFGLA